MLELVLDIDVLDEVDVDVPVPSSYLTYISTGPATVDDPRGVWGEPVTYATLFLNAVDEVA